MWRALVIATFFGVPAAASAAPYFEFAPDYSQPVTVQTGTTVSQVFAPLNDRLSSIELWVSTGGVAAGLDVSLKNASGAVLSTRTISLGSIADTEGGTRTKITLASQISVSGGEPYTLDITPTGSAVRIYRSTSVSIIPGSGSSSGTGYRYGRAIVGGEQQAYSFKFALTEAAETTNPDISDMQITHPSTGQTWLSFTASEPVDIQIAYGSRTFGWTGQFTPCLPGIVRCTVSLSVTPGTTYTYTLTTKDVWGNISTATGEFAAVGEGPSDTPSPSSSSAPGTTTPPPASTTPTAPPTTTPPPQEDVPPVISNPRLLGLSPTSATVAWTTDEAADSSVIMISEGIYAFDATRELEHYMTIDGLTPDHYYRMRVSSSDYWGNYRDVVIIFITPLTTTPSETTVVGASPTPSPAPSYTVIVPSGSLPPPASSIPSASPGVTASPGTPPAGTTTPTPSQTVVAYPSTSSEPGVIEWPPAGGDVDGYRIDIFDANGVLITTLTVGPGVTSVPLPAGLPVGAYIIVYADRGGAFEKVGAPTTVTDRPFEPARSPLLTSVLLYVGGGTLLVALIVALVWQRRRQKADVDATTSIGLGGGRAV